MKMRKTRNVLWIWLITLMAGPAWSGDADLAKKEQALLQGRWLMVSGGVDGMELPSGALKNSNRVCTGDETTVVIAGQLMMKAKFKLNASTKPKKIDYRITTGLNAGKTQLGIYEIEGDTVKFCFSTPGKERPTEFSTKTGDGRALSVWKREKAKG